MKKLSHIVESMWGDIHRRNSGEVTRKENDVNHLNRDEMYDYIYSHYEKLNTSANPRTGGTDAQRTFFSIPIFVQSVAVYYTLSAFYANDKIYKIHLSASDLDCKDFYDEMKKTFTLSEIPDHSLIISPKNMSKDVTNMFLLEVIDFICTHAKNPALKKKINESMWGDIHRRNSGEVVRKEDIPEQDFNHWWKNIPLKDVPKYEKDELRLWDFLYNLVIWKVENTMNIQKPEIIRIHFKYEDAWYLTIYHNTAHGSDNYTMEAKGTRDYSPVKYTEMNMAEKRSIRYRLEKKTFYIYPIKHGSWTEYILREEPEINGEKGVLMK